MKFYPLFAYEWTFRLQPLDVVYELKLVFRICVHLSRTVSRASRMLVIANLNENSGDIRWIF